MSWCWGGCEGSPLGRAADGRQGDGLGVGPGERQQGLRDGLGSGKILGTTSEFALSQHRNEALVNLRLL